MTEVKRLLLGINDDPEREAGGGAGDGKEDNWVGLGFNEP